MRRIQSAGANLASMAGMEEEGGGEEEEERGGYFKQRQRVESAACPA